MIYSMIIRISLLLFSSVPIHSFYLTNGAILEECSGSSITYLPRFDSTKLHCFNSAWRQTFIYLQYSCIRNVLTRIWTIKTNTGKNTGWPQVMSLMTGKDYTYYTKASLDDEPSIEENSKTFDPNFNQLTTYLWTSLGNGPQCRIKYTIIKEICTANIQPPGARLTELICYYGKQVFNLQKIDDQQRFDKLIDGAMRSGSAVVPNSPSGTVNVNNSQSIPNQSPSASQNPSSNLNPSALNNGKISFVQKNKIFLIIAGVVFALMILAIIGFIIMRSPGSASSNVADDTASQWTTD